MEVVKQNFYRFWIEFSFFGGEIMKEVFAINLCIFLERNYIDFIGVYVFILQSFFVKVEEIIFFFEFFL